MTDMQPKMQEIQEKYKDDPEKMSSEMMWLLKKSGGGPLKWCLTMLIQIPVFLGLFYNVRDMAQQRLATETYSFMHMFTIQFDQLQTVFYGIDLL
jgi:YidC/Oxa1 family membrane protein insertase